MHATVSRLTCQWEYYSRPFLLQGTTQVQNPRVQQEIESLHMQVGHVPERLSIFQAYQASYPAGRLELELGHRLVSTPHPAIRSFELY